MAYTKEGIEELLDDFADSINISDELFDAAETAYKSLGDWIDEESDDYIVTIYSQGSFALGTVVKPINNEDDYDLDLVCCIVNGSSLSADGLKNKIVKPWLENYKPHTTELEEKSRCWHVEYDEIRNFLMDVIPALPRTHSDESILITDKKAEHRYDYTGSDPLDYRQWFFDCCGRKKDVIAENMKHEMAVQEDVKQHKRKSKLQKAIQIMKRHRDVMFEKDPDNKPASIIITTLTAQLYDGERTIIDTIECFANGVETYLEKTKNSDGSYHIPNPTLTEEDFADKWSKHPIRQTAFFTWLQQLKIDFQLESLQKLDTVSMGKKMMTIFGEACVKSVFTKRGHTEATAVAAGTLKIDTTTGGITKTGTISVPPSHHYGEEEICIYKA